MSKNHSKGLKRKEERQVVVNPSVPSIMIAKHFTTAGTILMNCCLMNQIELRKVYDRSDWHVISTFFFHWASQAVKHFIETPTVNSKLKSFNQTRINMCWKQQLWREVSVLDTRGREVLKVKNPWVGWGRLIGVVTDVRKTIFSHITKVNFLIL